MIVSDRNKIDLERSAYNRLRIEFQGSGGGTDGNVVDRSESRGRKEKTKGEDGRGKHDLNNPVDEVDKTLGRAVALDLG